MPRPPKCRRISFLPDARFFKPAGIPVRELEELTLSLDEMEAIRLADWEGLYQEQAAAMMNVSRQTFANILAAAHRKIAESLLLGKALRIEGGNIEMGERQFSCQGCGHAWSLPFGSGCPEGCPVCRAEAIRCSLEGAGRERSCGRKRECCRKKPQEERE